MWTANFKAELNSFRNEIVLTVTKLHFTATTKQTKDCIKTGRIEF